MNEESGPGSNDITALQLDLKIDHRFSDRDQLSGNYSQQGLEGEGANAYGNVFSPNFTGPAKINAHLFALNHTHTFSATTILSLSYGFSRQLTDQRDVATNFSEDPIRAVVRGDNENQQKSPPSGSGRICGSGRRQAGETGFARGARSIRQDVPW